MRKFSALFLFVLSGMLAGLITVDYLRFLDFGGNTSEKIALVERQGTAEALAEVGQWHAQAFEAYKERMEWTLLAGGMLALLMFLNFIYQIAERDKD